MPDLLLWALVLVVAPLAAALAAFLRPASGTGLGLAVAGLHLVLLAPMVARLRSTGPVIATAGAWPLPLGISLAVDGLTVVMIAMTAVSGSAVTCYAGGYFSHRIKRARDARRLRHRKAYFWPLWLILWAGLNALFLARDLFHIYVTLELVGISAVLLTALSGKPAARLAAMRYLLVGLLGSLSFLLGVVFLYRTFGLLDMAAIAAAFRPLPLAWLALALISVGLLLKSALFPLHFWLPAAHANALAPVSALLSAVVIKAPLYLLFRLWGDLFAQRLPVAVLWLPGVLGACAVFWGTVQALQQQRLKMLVAYSTVAQVGVMVLGMPLFSVPGGAAWPALCSLLLAHSFAKSAMFLAAGAIFLHAGHDRIADLGGIKEDLPVAALAFVVAGVSLIGLPPSGGFIGKWLLIGTALRGGMWVWALLLAAASLLSAAYIYRGVRPMLTYRARFPSRRQEVPRVMEWAALLLALISLFMGLFAAAPLGLLEVGS